MRLIIDIPQKVYSDIILFGKKIDNAEERQMIHAFEKAIPLAESKIGHWKRISMDKYTEHAQHWYRCDRCGKDNLGNTDWCPNCGCRMVEPQERSNDDEGRSESNT